MAGRAVTSGTGLTGHGLTSPGGVAASAGARAWVSSATAARSGRGKASDRFGGRAAIRASPPPGKPDSRRGAGRSAYEPSMRETGHVFLALASAPAGGAASLPLPCLTTEKASRRVPSTTGGPAETSEVTKPARGGTALNRPSPTARDRTARGSGLAASSSREMVFSVLGDIAAGRRISPLGAGSRWASRIGHATEETGAGTSRAARGSGKPGSPPSSRWPMPPGARTMEKGPASRAIGACRSSSGDGPKAMSGNARSGWTARAPASIAISCRMGRASLTRSFACAATPDRLAAAGRSGSPPPACAPRGTGETDATPNGTSARPGNAGAPSRRVGLASSAWCLITGPGSSPRPSPTCAAGPVSRRGA